MRKRPSNTANPPRPPPKILSLLRFSLSFIAAAAFLLFPAIASAQSPAGFRLVTSPRGYQFQVPTDWQEQTNDELPYSVDLYYASPDGRQTIAAGAFHGATAGAPLLSMLVDAFLAGVSKTQAAQGGSAPNVFEGPAPVTVANSDAATGLIAIQSLATGEPEIVAARLAAKGQDVVVFTLTVPEAVYLSDANFGILLDSFALTP